MPYAKVKGNLPNDSDVFRSPPIALASAWSRTTSQYDTLVLHGVSPVAIQFGVAARQPLHYNSFTEQIVPRISRRRDYHHPTMANNQELT